MIAIAPQWYDWKYGLLGLLTLTLLPVARELPLILALPFVVLKRDDPNALASWLTGVIVGCAYLLWKFYPMVLRVFLS